MTSASPTSEPRVPRRAGPIVQALLAIWLILCFATYVAQAYDRLPGWLRVLLYTEYLQ